MIHLNLVYEDELDETVLVKILESLQGKFVVAQKYNGGGSSYIKKRISGFNNAAKFSPFLVVTDLDRSICPTFLIESWLGTKHTNQNLIFRVAVQEIESWILADRQGFADFLGISVRHIPLNPDEQNNPKERLIEVVKKSKKRSIREDIIPRSKYASIGPNYNGQLGAFVNSHWDIARATENSNSLLRAVAHLHRFEFKGGTK